MGDVVKGKVSRFAGFGVFVQLGEELEGLCHISELSDERVEKPEDVISIGQELDFKILRIEHDMQKIGLSARAVGKEEEPVIDTKSYSSEAKGGMTSLGELMNLKRGAAAPVEEKAKEETKLSKKERKALKAEEKALNEDIGDDLEDEDLSGANEEYSETEVSDISSLAAITEQSAEDVDSQDFSTQDENFESQADENEDSSIENAATTEVDNIVDQSRIDTTKSEETSASESENSDSSSTASEVSESPKQNSMTNAAAAESSENIKTQLETTVVNEEDSAAPANSETTPSESFGEEPEEKTAKS